MRNNSETDKKRSAQYKVDTTNGRKQKTVLKKSDQFLKYSRAYLHKGRYAPVN